MMDNKARFLAWKAGAFARLAYLREQSELYMASLKRQGIWFKPDRLEIRTAAFDIAEDNIKLGRYNDVMSNGRLRHYVAGIIKHLVWSFPMRCRKCFKQFDRYKGSVTYSGSQIVPDEDGRRSGSRYCDDCLKKPRAKERIY